MRLTRLIIVTIMSLVCAGFGETRNLYVTPADADSSQALVKGEAGKSGESVKGLKNVLPVIRKYREKHPDDEIVVNLTAGRYFMDQPLELTYEDSGKPMGKTIFRGAKDGKSVITGAMELDGFYSQGGNLWRLKVPAGVLVEQLYVNGKRAIPARYPNQGYLRIQESREEVIEPGDRFAKWSRFEITAKDDNLEVLKGIDFDAEKPRVSLFVQWSSEIRNIQGYDAEEGAIRFEGMGERPWNPLRENTPFCLEHFQAALDAAGEFWFDQTSGILYYMPREGEDINTAKAAIPVTKELIRIKGDYKAGKLVEHVSFENIHFEGSVIEVSKGIAPNQAGASTESVITADGAEYLEFTNCSFSMLGRWALWLKSGCKSCTVSRCRFDDLGAGAIRIGPAGVPADNESRTLFNTVSDCKISRGGRVVASSVGIWIGQAGYNRIVHNEISDFYYSGISAGWMWGYYPTDSKGNEIGYNRIYDLGHDVMSDLAGVYILGPSEGTRVHHNVIHDVTCDRYGAWGIYMDEGATGVLFDYNHISNCESMAYHLHYGKDNRVENNLFALNHFAQLQRGKTAEHLSLAVRRNVIVFNGDKVFWGVNSYEPWLADDVILSDNIYVWANERGIISDKVKSFCGMDFETWQKSGRDIGSVLIVDSLLPGKIFNPALLPDEILQKTGFEPFNVSNAGIRR